MAAATEVVACKVNKHDVFGILFWIVTQEVGILHVFIGIACALGGASNRVDEGSVALYAVVGFGR